MRLTEPQQLIYDMEKYAGGAIGVVCGSALFEGECDPATLQRAANEIYRLNDALRIRITEATGKTSQEIQPYAEREIPVLRFNNKAELDAYAEGYAKVPLDFYGDLCELSVILIPGSFGILAKTHHIVSDAWTLTLIGSQFYALANGETLPAYSYTDYLEKEQEYLQSTRYENDRAFFLKQFQRCEEVTYLSERQSNSFTAKRKSFLIDQEEARQITDYCSVRKTSPFSLFMTALATYFNRTKMNAEKFFLGTAVLNRSGPREKNAMGMFINTVPVLAELQNDGSFAENLRSVERSVLSVFRHQRCNYGDVLAMLRKECGFGEKLYDVMLSYQNAKITGKGETTWYSCGMQTESLQIHIDDRDSEGVFRIHYDYLTDLYGEQEIRALHEHLMNLFFSAIQNDSKKLYELDILSANERQRLLYDFNNTAVDYPRDKCVHTLFEEQAAKTPDKVAAIACDRTLTYRELNEEANRIAHSLIEHGVGVGDIVAFALPRKSYLISTMFGILKSGAAYLPIDPDYPQERIVYILHDSSAKCFISEHNSSEWLNGSVVDNPNVTVSNNNRCYCIYTSGSTGQPKGAAILHRNLINFCSINNLNNLQSFIAKECSTVLACGSITFDISIFEIILSLLLNKTVVLADDRTLFNAALLGKIIKSHNVDCIHSTPSKIQTYLETEAFADSFARIKCAMIGGETLSLAVVDAIRNYSPTKIYNGYGPTETTLGVSFGEINNDLITIGKPIANTQIYIVDPYMNPVPIGATGELCIAGDGVGAGYLNRPELTAERFIDNPFGKGKLYKTGDLAYWREDGNIVYVGRNDFQVKIRGLRIELGEIESAMNAFDGISQAVVTAQKDAEGRQYLVGYYVSNHAVDEHALRTHLGSTLPKYMVPHYFQRLDAMPLTASGKINRKALPSVNLTQLQEEYAAPETATEQTLCDIVAKALRLDRVGRIDDFFDLGGDSLLAIFLLNDFETAFGKRLETSLIMRHSVMWQLAEAIDATDRFAEEIPVLGQSTYPLLPQQMGIYTAVMTGSDPLVYNMPMKVSLPESVDLARLKSAILTLYKRHEELRYRFVQEVNGVFAKRDDAAVLQFETVTEKAAFVRPFDLQTAPLFRVGFAGHTMYLDLHHILADGESVHLLLRELRALYDGEALPERGITYGDYAHFFAQKAANGSFRDAFDFYKTALQGDWEPVALPKKLHTQAGVGISKTYSINKTQFQKAKQLAQKLGVTDTALLLSVYGILLSKYSGQEEVLSSVVLTNRTHAQTAELVGMLVNTMPIFLRAKPELTFAEYAKTVNETLLGMYQYQELPFLMVADALGDVNKAAMNTSFVYQAQGEMAFSFAGESAVPEVLNTHTAKFDLTAEITPSANGAFLRMEYPSAKLDGGMIDRMAESYCLLLDTLQEDTLLQNASVISAAERKKLLYEFNDTTVDYPKDKCVHTLFEEQVARTPDKVAVIACDKTLTYRELNEEANRIAHSLIERGVGVGDIVAFALSRKSYLISAIFGILKSGAAYLPIDPDYPQDRIDYMLEDSNATLFVTENSIEKLLNGSRIQNPGIKVSGDGSCYCIYTSGSMGKPKGVKILHYNLVNFCLVNNHNLQGISLNRGNVLLSMFNCCFDAFGVDYALSLINEKTMLLVANADIGNPSRISELIKKNEADIIHTTPAVLNTLSQSDEFKKVLSQIKVVLVGAEVFGEALYQTLESNTNATILNGYGPSETTIGVSFANIRRDGLTIGRPIANTQVYIIDKQLQLVPIGVTGELCIAGDGVGAGYLNRPELTAERFIDNPFGVGKLYKTGDLAYWREDGNIVYVGRNDFQVKIRGLRIELGEIESAMNAFDGISQAVVTAQKDAEGRQYLVGYYVSNHAVDEHALRTHLGSTLPKYMVPNYFFRLGEWPMTTSGKINRKALPAVDLSRSTEYVAPKTTLQKQICDAFAKTLGLEQVGITDDFFELGGDSLRAIELLCNAQDSGIRFELQAIYEYPTVEALSAFLTKDTSESVRIQPEQFEKFKPLLSKNTVPKYIPAKQPLGTVFLTGATGFLGAHVLDSLLTCDCEKVYCLVRQDSSRLWSELRYYFGNKYDNDTRIVPVVGSLETVGSLELPERIHFVIHTAANVKHYGNYADFYHTNVVGTQHVIEFAKRQQAKMIHISTTSVSGVDIAGNAAARSETEKSFSEADLYIGQTLENVYVRSKFFAECAVLDAALEGMPVNIVRVGNLTNRRSDGLFQPNYETNAFLKRLKAIHELGCFPDYLMDLYSEFSPIDDTAEAIVKIAEHFTPERTVYHVYNNKHLYFKDMLPMLEALGISMEVVPDKEFSEKLMNASDSAIRQALINDLDADGKWVLDSNIRIQCGNTVKYLEQLGFTWVPVDYDYLKRYFEFFRSNGYLS